MRKGFALWLAIMIIVWSIIIPAGATVLFLILVNASAELSILVLITIGIPLTITGGAMSYDWADRAMDWVNHAP